MRKRGLKEQMYDAVFYNKDEKKYRDLAKLYFEENPSTERRVMPKKKNAKPNPKYRNRREGRG